MKALLAGVCLLALGACTQAQLSAAESIVAVTAATVQSACTEALKVAGDAQAQLKGGALNTANDIINNYLAPGCGSATQVAALAMKPDSAAWVGALNGMLSSIINPPKVTA